MTAFHTINVADLQIANCEAVPPTAPNGLLSDRRRKR
jgi:hypothetical protein